MGSAREGSASHRYSYVTRRDTRKQPGVGAAELAEGVRDSMVQFGTLTATTLSPSQVWFVASARGPEPDPSQMSADDQTKRCNKAESRPPRSSRECECTKKAPRGEASRRPRRCSATRGVSKKHGKKDKHGKKEIPKKDKHSKREKKKRRRKDRDSDKVTATASPVTVVVALDGGRAAWKTSKKGKVKDDWGPLPGPGRAIETISDEDYYLKNREFAAWLKRDRGVYFTDLSAAEARTAFKSFIVEWNERQLPMKFYEEDGIVATGRR